MGSAARRRVKPARNAQRPHPIERGLCILSSILKELEGIDLGQALLLFLLA